MAKPSRGSKRSSRRRRSRGNLAKRSPTPRRRLIWPILASVVFVGVLFVAVFPTQTLLGQQSEADEKRAELESVESRNAELQSRVAELEDPDYIEQLAREEFGLVKPGEESYVIVPPAEEGPGASESAGDVSAPDPDTPARDQ